MELLLRGAALAALPGIGHGFETRSGRLRDAGPRQVARLRQVHGATVHVIDADTSPEPYLLRAIEARPAGDALITDVPGLGVAVATADCVPILLADPVRRVVAAVHAGWRGITAEVVSATLERMRQRFDSKASDCVAAIGPCASANAYEVSAEVRDAFLGHHLAPELFTATRPGHWRCDLPGAVAQQLRQAGVEAIDVLGRCTVSEPATFHSWRRDGPAAGRMLSGIFLAG